MPNLDYYNTARMHQMVNSFQNILTKYTYLLAVIIDHDREKHNELTRWEKIFRPMVWDRVDEYRWIWNLIRNISLTLMS